MRFPQPVSLITAPVRLKPKPTYILGTGLSHDGSACILRDGRIAVAIEKERITRRKHDGGNDAAAVQYCLDALGLQLADMSLIVQAANFEKDISPELYAGKRLYHPDVPVVTISHHLAHAYSAIGTSPFRESNVLVIDGAGSPAAQCDDWPDEISRNFWQSRIGFYCEKDSFYRYDGAGLHCLHKDFSEVRLYGAHGTVRMPLTHHSIGGVYAAASHYCFGNLDDAGKLMGLAPYGRESAFSGPIFDIADGSLAVRHEVLDILQSPAEDYAAFKADFQHYADVARWVQAETERAVVAIARHRTERFPHDNLCYAGGVALNAVSNARLLKERVVRNLYLQPAAGDNGLALGCAFYGWHGVHQREIIHQPSSTVFFGKEYGDDPIASELRSHPEAARFSWRRSGSIEEETAGALAAGKVAALFRGGAEFGPRALGHRSILADPRIPGIRERINRDIKFREDFRPFAPAVRREDVSLYFEHGWDSPYMILVDDIRPEWKEQLAGVVHVNGTCRVQTVEESWNPHFHRLLTHFSELTGVGVLINTSFNRRGMPIVETPREALDFFLECALDVLVMEEYFVEKI